MRWFAKQQHGYLFMYSVRLIKEATLGMYIDPVGSPSSSSALGSPLILLNGAGTENVAALVFEFSAIAPSEEERYTPD